MKAIVIGARHLAGQSKKSGNPYDFAVLFVLKPLELAASTEKMKLTGAGYQVAEVRTSLDVVRSIQQCAFPQEMELEIENQLGRMNNMEAVCVKVKPSKPAVSAAARLAGTG